MKGGYEKLNIKMDTKKIVLWAIIAILLIAVVYVTFIKGGSTGAAISTAQSAGQAAVSSGGMVGGC